MNGLARYAWSFSPWTGSYSSSPARCFFKKPFRAVRAAPLIAASLPVTHPGQLPHLFRIDVLYLLGAIGAVTGDEAVSAHCRHEAHVSRPLMQGFGRSSSESEADNDFLLYNLTQKTGEKFPGRLTENRFVGLGQAGWGIRKRAGRCRPGM